MSRLKPLLLALRRRPKTPPPAYTTASHAVLLLPELLELILLALPPRRALILQRVCTTWRAVLSSSPSLQRVLFLRPTAPCRFSFVSRGEAPRVNHLLDTVLARSGLVPKPGAEGWTPCAAGPHVRARRYALAETRELNRALVRRTSASFRDMQLADPPVKSVRVRISGEREGLHFADVEGVRVGPVRDAVGELLVRIMLKWDWEGRYGVVVEFYGDRDGG
ncbi:hypothetical protein EJ06DRAFT_557205 [Trichodelitschia bisporula]|uniref:F-box domain-containing protein n=1 Tax=Trichodelitschia bisporula TaxID=703511 RepID=A0A6G1HTM2_9PEZI|nr:hypothetical protein EJ06DRAFT_557205 [Trichodelitschia bisporula]